MKTRIAITTVLLAAHGFLGIRGESVLARITALPPEGGTLRFEKGEYHFYEADAQTMWLDPSNNQSGEKRVVFPLVGRKNVTIDGWAGVPVRGHELHGAGVPQLHRDDALSVVSRLRREGKEQGRLHREVRRRCVSVQGRAVQHFVLPRRQRDIDAGRAALAPLARPSFRRLPHGAGFARGQGQVPRVVRRGAGGRHRQPRSALHLLRRQAPEERFAAVQRWREGRHQP